MGLLLLPIKNVDIRKELLIIKYETALLIFAVFIINIALTNILYIPPIMDTETVKELASHSVTGGLGFYVFSISSDLNVFIFCTIVELLLYKIYVNTKYNHYLYK